MVRFIDEPAPPVEIVACADGGRPRPIGENRHQPPAELWSAAAHPDPDGVPEFALSSEDTWSRLLRFIGHWTVFGFGPFVVIERVTGSLVGEIGYGYFQRGFGDDYDHVPEAMSLGCQ